MGLRRWSTGLVVCLAACIVPAPSGETVATTAGPPLTVTSGANFGGKVELVRVSFRPGRLVPGDAVRVSLVFRVLAPIEEDYLIFVHLEDGLGRAERRNADHPPLGGSRPTHTWKPGELLTDEFVLEAPPGVTQLLNVWAGLWQPLRDRRLKVQNTQNVRTDGTDRVLLAQLPVGP